MKTSSALGRNAEKGVKPETLVASIVSSTSNVMMDGNGCLELPNWTVIGLNTGFLKSIIGCLEEMWCRRPSFNKEW